MMHRRDFIIFGAAGLVAGCQSGPPKPSSVTVNLTGRAGMNPGPGGGDRPLTVLLVRLKDVAAFNSADYFALQADASAALGGDLVGMDQVVVAPGGNASRTIGFEPGATHLGMIALVREPGGRIWRTTVPVAVESTTTVNVALAAGGLSVRRG